MNYEQKPLPDANGLYAFIGHIEMDEEFDESRPKQIAWVYVSFDFDETPYRFDGTLHGNDYSFEQECFKGLWFGPIKANFQGQSDGTTILEL